MRGATSCRSNRSSEKDQSKFELRIRTRYPPSRLKNNPEYKCIDAEHQEGIYQGPGKAKTRSSIPSDDFSLGELPDQIAVGERAFDDFSNHAKDPACIDLAKFLPATGFVVDGRRSFEMEQHDAALVRLSRCWHRSR